MLFALKQFCAHRGVDLTLSTACRSGKLRLAIRISPPFVRYTRWVDTPQAGMTTFHFASATADQASTVVRLLNFGEDSGESPSRVSMAASAEVASSLLFLTFDHFNDTLLFDPGRQSCLAHVLDAVAIGC
jgi:hypothetical protein